MRLSLDIVFSFVGRFTNYETDMNFALAFYGIKIKSLTDAAESTRFGTFI